LLYSWSTCTHFRVVQRGFLLNFDIDNCLLKKFHYTLEVECSVGGFLILKQIIRFLKILHIVVTLTGKDVITTFYFNRNFRLVKYISCTDNRS
jgi:hypothetical protein